ncbi:hypothetical protein PVAND_001325 [Polypedilum vanderplanki]|uniref:CRAL-TRIO domain-containing protein n=1 Tax=Polypedilum vanderplanki TaxID=319348 RepID=A0A9J6BN47_POLVA|nr:hypothetical protein PVAND_001325 [Polypedilum vanderplanki]
MSSDLKKYQTKSITPVDEYKCTLSKELQEKAEIEIGETPEVRDKGLREFREWIYKNPRIIKCRMDSLFLLRFLRCHKYIMHRVKEAFERYLIFREGLDGFDWFSNLDTEREHLQDLLNAGLYIVLPEKAKTGEKVIMMRMHCCEPDSDVVNACLTLTTLIMETLFDESEENQIRGFRYILDVSNIRMKHYFVWSIGTWIRIMKHIERTLVARHKGCHVINMNSALKFVAKIATHNMKDKLRGGLQFHSNAEELKDFIDLKSLPKEQYGGDYTIEEIVEPYRKALKVRRKLFLSYSQMKINQEYYVPSVLKCETKSLNYTLENKKGGLLTKYDDDSDSDNENC